MIQSFQISVGDCSRPFGKSLLNRFFVIPLLFVAALFNGCSTPPMSTSATPEPFTISMEQTMVNLVNSDETVVVTLDAVYKSRKQYRGFSFLRLLNSKGYKPPMIAEDTVVQFICKDGYNPIAPLSTLLQDGAFIATSDLEAPSDQNWIQFKYGDSLRDPGQFYLVWPHTMAASDGHPWPYGIMALRVGSPSALLEPSLPKSEQYLRGSKLFRENCMMCHSINGIGGTVGIDLNVPRNVFEYWQADKLPAMVANPSAFRRNAKMPAFDRLGKQTIWDILEYVKCMKANKIQPAHEQSHT